MLNTCVEYITDIDHEVLYMMYESRILVSNI